MHTVSTNQIADILHFNDKTQKKLLSDFNVYIFPGHARVTLS